MKKQHCVMIEDDLAKRIKNRLVETLEDEE